MDILIGVFIYLIVPLIGLGLFLRLANKMYTSSSVNPPIFELFLVFVTYGGLVIVALATLIGKWSGLASLGAGYVAVGGPIVMGIISYQSYRRRAESKYRRQVLLMGLLYLIIMPLIFGGLFVFELNK